MNATSKTNENTQGSRLGILATACTAGLFLLACTSGAGEPLHETEEPCAPGLAEIDVSELGVDGQRAALAQARYERAMHERSLVNLEHDPRWSVEEQREYLAVAVSDTKDALAAARCEEDALRWHLEQAP